MARYDLFCVGAPLNKRQTETATIMLIAILLQDCNDFKAGNKLRSKSKSGKLSETGIFGAVCRHELPLLFLNMRHGER